MTIDPNATPAVVLSDESNEASSAIDETTRLQTSPGIGDEHVGKPNARLMPQPWHGRMTTDILDKQYRLYSWNDSKVLALITTNSILLATMGFLFKECLTDAFSLLAISLAFLFLGTSLAVSLWQVFPQGSSGKSGTTPNVRALSGITGFSGWKLYQEALYGTDEAGAIEAEVRQIYGMACNNDKSRNITSAGVWLTLVGLVFLVITVVGVALSAHDVHVIGKWARTSQEASQRTDTVQPGSDKSVDSPTPRLVNSPQPDSARPAPAASDPKQSNSKQGQRR